MMITNKNYVLLFLLMVLMSLLIACTKTEELYPAETSPTETTPPLIIQEYKPPFIIEEFCPLTPEAVKQYCDIKADLKLSEKYDCMISSLVAGPLLKFNLWDMQYYADAFGEPRANNLQEFLEAKNRQDGGFSSSGPPPECSQGPARLSVPNAGDEAIAESGLYTFGGKPCPVTSADFEENTYDFYVRKGDRAMGHFLVYGTYKGDGCSPEELGRLAQDLVVPKLKAVPNN